MRQKMADMVHRIQDEICEALREIDGVDYRQDEWTREEGGGGRSRVFSGGKVFEKAGVNVSIVYGTLSPQAAKSMGGGHELQGTDLDFFATGISLVLHPINPMAPTVHANYRYFERGEGQKPGSWWFGGGADLTPSFYLKKMQSIFIKYTKTRAIAMKWQISQNSSNGVMTIFTSNIVASEEASAAFSSTILMTLTGMIASHLLPTAQSHFFRHIYLY